MSTPPTLTPTDAQAAKRPRTVTPPPPVVPPGAQFPSSTVVSVQIADGEEVDWTWTTFPDGAQAVTGYTVRKAEPAGAAA